MTPRCATDEPRWSTLSDEGRRDVQARPNFDHDIGLSHEHARNSSNLPCCRRGPCNSSLGDSRQRWRADALRVLGFDRSWPVLSIAAGGKAMECDPGRGTWEGGAMKVLAPTVVPCFFVSSPAVAQDCRISSSAAACMRLYSSGIAGPTGHLTAIKDWEGEFRLKPCLAKISWPAATLSRTRTNVQSRDSSLTSRRRLGDYGPWVQIPPTRFFS